MAFLQQRDTMEIVYRLIIGIKNEREGGRINILYVVKIHIQMFRVLDSWDNQNRNNQKFMI